MVRKTNSATKRAKWRPWLWPFSLATRITHPIPPGIWLQNWFCQRILRVNSEVPWSVHFTSRVRGKVTVGENSSLSFAISGSCYIQAVNGVEIGDNTIFASGVKIISANHDFENLGEQVVGPPIRIGSRVWIGANAVILPGVQIGDNSVIGAGSIVTKDVASGSIVAGNPARLLKEKKSTV